MRIIVMITRLRTSKESKERLLRLSAALRFSNNAIVLRYALIKSLQCDKDIYEDPAGKVNDTSGFEITRSTLFGSNEIIFKILSDAENIEDEEFFPKLINMHLERGLKLLDRDYQLAGNKDKLIRNYINMLDN